jgi:hypothetical protein
MATTAAAASMAVDEVVASDCDSNGSYKMAMEIKSSNDNNALYLGSNEQGSLTTESLGAPQSQYATRTCELQALCARFNTPGRRVDKMNILREMRDQIERIIMACTVDNNYGSALDLTTSEIATYLITLQETRDKMITMRSEQRTKTQNGQSTN